MLTGAAFPARPCFELPRPAEADPAVGTSEPALDWPTLRHYRDFMILARCVARSGSGTRVELDDGTEVDVDVGSQLTIGVRHKIGMTGQLRRVAQRLRQSADPSVGRCLGCPVDEVRDPEVVSDADDVLVAAQERAAALAGKDEARLRALLHPRFVWISHKGEWFDLEPYLASNRGAPNIWHDQDLRDVEVRVIDRTAVLRCIVLDTVDVNDGGPDVFVMPMTQTWVKTGAGWRCLAGHAGPRLPS